VDDERERDRDRENGGEDRATVRAFAAGGRVRETGIALVHEGEYVLPAPGSEAEVEAVDAGAEGGARVSYTFPVRIVYAGGLTEEDRRSVEEGIWGQLMDAFERQE
jgi:hypothetical protein